MKLNINCHYKSGWFFGQKTIYVLIDNETITNFGKNKIQIFIR